MSSGKYRPFCFGLNVLSKQWRRRWFETPSRSLWRHCNDNFDTPIRRLVCDFCQWVIISENFLIKWVVSRSAWLWSKSYAIVSLFLKIASQCIPCFLYCLYTVVRSSSLIAVLSGVTCHDVLQCQCATRYHLFIPPTVYMFS